MSQPITEFIGVYDADSTLIGEISYWIGARLGRTHCSLCELTHGVFTKKRQWKECSRDLSIPVSMHHRNDAPADVLALANDSFPLLLARHIDGLRVVLTNKQLSQFNGSTEEFSDWLTDYIASSS